MDDHRIVFTPSGLNGTVEHGTTVLEAARRLGADLDTVCGGRGICGRCQVAPSERLVRQVGDHRRRRLRSGRRRRSRPTTAEAAR